MGIDYTALRLVRHFMPRSIVHFLLRHELIIKPGFETRAPHQAIQRYLNTLEIAGRSIVGQRILVFGYGGNYALACSLLQAGAEHVTLIDKYADPDNYHNQKLIPEFENYLTIKGNLISPRPEYITMWEGDVQHFADHLQSQTKFDLILSSSVYEHLDDVPGITRALAALTKPDGCHVHYVDLRDHYFKYPFQMLTYSENTWKNWLNPGSNLNRYRVNNYRRVFEHYFEDTKITVLERDLTNFKKMRTRIRSEFISGDEQVDSVTLIMIFAAKPRLLNSGGG